MTPIKQIMDKKTVELVDGTRVEVDSICTGYTVDYSILGKSDPGSSATCPWTVCCYRFTTKFSVAKEHDGRELEKPSSR